MSHKPSLILDKDSPVDQQKNSKEWVEFSQMNSMHYSLLMSLFSLSTTILSHPLTAIAIRQQANSAVTGEKQFKLSILSSLSARYRLGGMKSVFRGWVPMATIGMPSNVIFFNAIEITRESFQSSIRAFYPDAPQTVVDGVQSAASAIIANFISLIPYVPAEVISSRLIVSSSMNIGMIDICKSIYKERGARGFFVGFAPSLYVYAVGSTQWWWSYSLCRRYMADKDLAIKYPIAADCLAGTLSGLSAVLVSHPFDTIKTRIMTNANTTNGQSSTFLSEFQSIIKKEGYFALYRGLRAMMYQAAIGSTLFAGAYEAIKLFSAEV